MANSSAEQCRALAERATRMAEAAMTMELRDSYLQIAKVWRELADQIERHFESPAG